MSYKESVLPVTHSVFYQPTFFQILAGILSEINPPN